MKPPAKKIVIASTSKRDLLIGIGLGALLLGFVLYGIANLSHIATYYRLTGTILSKNFTPQPEEQLTIGKGGLRERQLDGTYTFEVKVDSQNGRTYTIWIDKTIYDTHKIGDSYTFMRPPPSASSAK